MTTFTIETNNQVKQNNLSPTALHAQIKRLERNGDLNQTKITDARGNLIFQDGIWKI